MKHEDKIRYSRNISIPEIGKEGQTKLLNSKVLVVGAGGLGSPVLLYLSASGVGTIGIIDHDKVNISNLQRQIIHETEDVGRPKTHSAKDAILDLNPNINVICFDEQLNKDNVENLIADFDIIVDGTDNFKTRFIVNKACFNTKKTLVSSAIIGFSGQLYTFKGYDKNLPCYQCLVSVLPPEDATPKCSNSGVLGSLGGIIGSLAASEVIKEITGAGKSLAGSMLVFDQKKTEFRKVRIKKDKNCECCR